MNYKIMNKVQENIEKFRELNKQINDLEIELEWAENQLNDYRYISELEKKIDNLYAKLEEYEEAPQS
jgi:uncharacterized coiled-coil DUF342 family protein